MKVITHSLELASEGIAVTRNVSICPICEAHYGLPDHIAYKGVSHGLHEGECHHPKHASEALAPVAVPIGKIDRDDMQDILKGRLLLCDGFDMRADWTNAACPIDFRLWNAEWDSTPFQVADCQHNKIEAERMIRRWIDNSA